MSNKFQVPSSLTLEPNPFEQSFAEKPSAPGQVALPVESPVPQQRLPGVQELRSPAPLLAAQGQWQQGPHLSPAILTGKEGIPGYQHSMPSPAVMMDPKQAAAYKVTKNSAPVVEKRTRQVKNEASSEEEKKRNLFLERNRIAAVKCRQRKKQWVNGLKGKVDYYQSANEELTSEVTRLKSNIDRIKQYLYSVQDPRQIPPQVVALLDTSQVSQQVVQHPQAVSPAQPAPVPSQPQQPPQVPMQQGEYQNVVLMVPQQMMMQGGTRPN